MQVEFCILKNIILSEEGQISVVYQYFQTFKMLTLFRWNKKTIVIVYDLNENLKNINLLMLKPNVLYKTAHVIVSFTYAIWKNLKLHSKGNIREIN